MLTIVCPTNAEPSLPPFFGVIFLFFRLKVGFPVVCVADYPVDFSFLIFVLLFGFLWHYVQVFHLYDSRVRSIYVRPRELIYGVFLYAKILRYLLS